MNRIRFFQRRELQRLHFPHGEEPLSDEEQEGLKAMFNPDWEQGKGDERLRNIPERFQFQPPGYNATYEHKIALDLLLLADQEEGFEYLIRWVELLYIRESIHWTTAMDALDLLGSILPNDHLDGVEEWFHQQIERIVPSLLRIARDPNPKRKNHVTKALTILDIRPSAADRQAAFESIVAEPQFSETVRKMAKHVLSGGRIGDFEVGLAKLEDIEL